MTRQERNLQTLGRMLVIVCLLLVLTALFLGCSGKRFGPLPQRAGDGITPEILEAWADAQEIIIEADVVPTEKVLAVSPYWFQFHRVDRIFVCRPDLARLVRGCFDPRWNLVRYVDGRYSTIVHECLHAIFWGLDMHDVGHGLVDFP